MAITTEKRNNWLYAVSFIFALIAQKLLFFDKNALAGVVFFAAAAFIIFIVSDEQKRPVTGRIPVTPSEIVGFFFIMSVAIFMRIFMLDSLPPGLFADEAQNGLNAVSIINGTGVDGAKLPIYIPDTTHNAAAFIYIIAACFKFLGVNAMNIRLAAVIPGILAVAGLYFLVRGSFGVKAALFSAFIFAIMRWHVNFSRIGFHASFGVLVMIIFLYFFMKALREKKAFDFIAAGAILAFSQYTYQPARLLPLAAFLGIIVAELKQPNFIRENIKKLALAIAACGLVITPLAYYIFLHYQDYIKRVNDVSILNKDAIYVWFGSDMPFFRVLLYNIQHTLLMFNSFGDLNPRHNLAGTPVLDFVTGIAAAMGMCFALKRKDGGQAIIFFIFFMVCLVPGIMTIEAPQALRTVFAAPFFALFAGLLMEKITSGSGSMKPAGYAAAVAACLIAAGLNYDVYFNRQFGSREAMYAFNDDLKQTGIFVSNAGPSREFRLHERFYSNPTFNFMMLNEPHKLYAFDAMADLPLPATKARYVELLLPTIFEAMEETLKYYYPHITKEEAPQDISGFRLFTMYTIPGDDVNNCGVKPGKNGLTAEYFKDSEWRVKTGQLRVEPLVFDSWDRAPVKTPYSKEWRGKIYIERSDYYYFALAGNTYTELYLDGRSILLMDGIQKQIDMGLDLKKGMHDIKVRTRAFNSYSESYLFWKRQKDESFRSVPTFYLYPEQ